MSLKNRPTAHTSVFPATATSKKALAVKRWLGGGSGVATLDHSRPSQCCA
jgi:hypothetical protein